MRKLLLIILTTVLLANCGESKPVDYIFDVVYTDGTKESFTVHYNCECLYPTLNDGCLKDINSHTSWRCGVRTYTLRKVFK